MFLNIRTTSRIFQSFQALKSHNRNASRLSYSEYGVPLDVLRLETFDSAASISPNEVRVSMKLSPVNPADINTIQGTYPLKPPLPAVGGGEGFGEVVEIGKEVEHLHVGDWVIPSKPMWGTWSTEVVGTEVEFIKIRNDIDEVSAATLMVNPSTAYRMLKDFVTLTPGDVIIQNGANSAVGRAVIQIAKIMDVTTVNIVRSRENIDELKRELQGLGADYVWTEEELRKTSAFRDQTIPKPKLALNCVGGQSSTEVGKTLDRFGIHVTYGGMSLKPVIVPTSALIFKDIRIRGFWMTRWVDQNLVSPERTKMYDQLAAWAFGRRLLPPSHVIVPVTEYKEAVEKTLKGYKAGKYLIDLR